MLASGRLTIVEVVELGIAELLAGPREPLEIVEGGIAQLDAVPGLRECDEGKQEHHREEEKDLRGDTSCRSTVYASQGPTLNATRLRELAFLALSTACRVFYRQMH